MLNPADQRHDGVLRYDVSLMSISALEAIYIRRMGPWSWAGHHSDLDFDGNRLQS
jgi:hypothetical protein